VGSEEPKQVVVVAEGDGSLLIGEIRLLGKGHDAGIRRRGSGYLKGLEA